MEWLGGNGDNGVTHWLNALNHRVLWDYWPDGSVKVMTNAADKKCIRPVNPILRSA